MLRFPRTYDPLAARLLFLALATALGAEGVGCRAVLDLEEGVYVPPTDDDGGADAANDGSADDVAVTDTGPGAPRVLTFMAAAPDRPTTYVCFVQFAKPGDETSQPPVASFGPWDDGGAGFAYGDVARLQADPALDAILASGNGFVFVLDDKPSGGGEPCRGAWLSADRARSARLQVPPGGSFVIASTGCAGTGSECGAGGNLAVSVHELSTAPPEAGKVAVQFLHLSRYAGEGGTGGPPSMQNTDVYLQPMKDASTSDGPSIAIAGAGTASGASFGTLVSPPVQITLPSSGPDPQLLFAPHGSSVCVPSPPSPPACPTLPIPFDKSKSPDGGRKLETGGSWVVAVSGGPKSGTAGTLAAFVARARP